jgi:hypothetical protein
MSQKRSYTLIMLAMVSASALMLSGCEWDNSEDYENQEPLFGDGNDNPTTNPGGPTTGDPGMPGSDNLFVSGVVATSEVVEGAVVCLDQNDNGVCDEGEPQTRTDELGEWKITLADGESLSGPVNVVAQTDPPDTILANSGDPVSWQYNLVGTATPDFSGSASGILVSPISVLVENERQKLPSGDLEKAIQNVAGKLGTNADILENYISPPSGSSPVDEQDYKRLQRIASVINELAKEIDSEITNEQRQQLSEKELNTRIFEKVDNALPKIVDDVNLSLVEQPSDADFQPDIVIGEPEYEQDRQAPDTTPPSSSATELEQRISTAVSDSPFFVSSGFETFPVVGAGLLDFEFFDNPLRPGQVYYEARQRITTTTIGDEAITDLNVAVPAKFQLADQQTTFRVISETDCIINLFDNFFDINKFDCQKLQSRPLTIRALSWTGFSFQTETVQIGHQGRQRTLAINELGDLIASSTSSGFSTRRSYRQFSLEGLDGRDVLKNFTKTYLPGTQTWTFEPGTLAYTVSESLNDDVYLSQWPQGDVGNLCPSPGLPDASVTASCNLVYGAIGQETGLPSETFSEALYPPAQRDQAYNSILENGEPVDAMRLQGPNSDVYVARLFGSAQNDTGTIAIDRRTDAGFQTLSIVGSWKRSGLPFPRIDLFLPDGFSYVDARLKFSLGRAYLFERQGFLRHGWMIPKDVNLDSLFDRQQVKFAFSQAAFDQMIREIEGFGILAEHPYYSAILNQEQVNSIQ